MIALSLIAKATLVTAFAIIAARLTRRQRAAVRHLMFVAAFVVLALLPVATAVMPAVPLSVRHPSTPAAPATEQAIPLVSRLEALIGAGGELSRFRATARTWPAISTFTLLVTVWLVGATACFVRLSLGLWQIHRIRRTGLPWRGAESLTNRLARDVGFGRHVEVLVHEAIVGPMTCGVLRPVIVFPRDARTWPYADVRRAVTHELEHIRRGDWVSFGLARTVCALYWFHPLVWIANRQLCVTAEQACDDAVVREGEALGYADQLVTLAERSLARRRRPLLAMANRHDLSTRVRAVLDMRQPRGPAGVRARAAITLVAAGSLVTLAPLRTVASPIAQTTSVDQRVAPSFEVASIRRNISADDGTMRNLGAGGRMVFVNFTLRQLIAAAYDVASFQVSGGPPWIGRDRFDVTAKAAVAAPLPELNLMVRQLLADRFKLEIRVEQRDLPRYRLSRLREAFGPSLKPSTADCGPTGLGDPRPGKPRSAADCHRVLTPAQIDFAGQRLSTLVDVLEMIFERPVVDTTGLTGAYDFEVSFPAEAVANAARPSDLAPALITGLQEQLGLKVEPERGPVDVIVVESAEQPTAN